MPPMPEVMNALLWWLILSAIGVAAFPIAQILFRFLPDRGYAFSRPLGLLLMLYAFWLLGTAHLVPNNTLGAVIVLLILAAVSGRIASRNRRGLQAYLRRNWGFILAVEAVWAGTFVLWGLVRSHTAAIAHTEQPMDFAILNGILHSPHFPPHDPWSAGQSISYYYGGYLIAAMLTHLTGIASSVTYNLSLITTAAMAAAGVFGLAYSLILGISPKAHPAGAMMGGVLAVVMLLFMGNLEGALEFLRVNGLAGEGFFSWVGIDGLTEGGGATWYPTENWWWWRATRVINTFVNGQGIDYTITEFPAFSFLLGDMHPHVMALPFGLLALGLSLNVLRSRSSLGLGWLQRHPWEGLVLAVLFGSLGFINTWDLPTFMAVLLGALLLRTALARSRGDNASYISALGLWAVLLIGAVMLYALFYLGLGTQANGALPVRRVMTRPIHFLIVLGPLLLPNLILLSVIAWRTLRSGTARPKVSSPRPDLAVPGAVALADQDASPAAGMPVDARPRVGALWLLALPLAPFLLWAAVELFLGATGDTRLLGASHPASLGASFLAVGTRFWHILPLVVITSLALGVMARAQAKRLLPTLPPAEVLPLVALTEVRRRPAPDIPTQNTSVLFALLLILAAFGLAMGAELFRIADFFDNRMNTVFKFYYQIWMLLTVAGAAGLFWVFGSGTLPRMPRVARTTVAGAASLAVAGLLAGLAFLPPAVLEKTGNLSRAATLDGLAEVRQNDQAEYEAVRWLLEHSRPGDVLIEGVPVNGDQPAGDYDAGAGRMAQRTGLPTVLGWPGHEHQWRGGSYEPMSLRFRNVETVFRTGSPEEINRVLDTYRVRYVIVGEPERRHYGTGVASRFDGVAGVAFQSGGVLILERSAR